MSDLPAAISVYSPTRRIDLVTPLDEEGAWLLLSVPDGATDVQVLAWAEKALPPAAVAELRERIAEDARAEHLEAGPEVG